MTNERAEDVGSSAPPSSSFGTRLSSAAAPLAYARPARRYDSVWGVIGLSLGIICAMLPGVMAWQFVVEGRWAVYTPYTNQAYGLSYHVNWPWYALDCLAILLGLIGLYRGRARFAVAALAVAGMSLVVTLTIVLGSPW